MASESKEGSNKFEVHRPYVPPRQPNTDYPLIDNDPHFKRVLGYMRTSDYVVGAGSAALLPGAVWLTERISPSYAGPRLFARAMRLNWAFGLTGGFIMAYMRSTNRFYGAIENSREVAMDMKEMTARAKAGLPLYGESRLSEYMQGVAARNSRYSGVYLYIFPMFNFVNHPYHGVDTAKYYQAAERELESEKSR